MSSFNKISENIRTRRRSLNMSQVQLAEKAGISVNSVRLCEGGKVQPRIDTISKIADALGCSVSDLDYGVSALAEAANKFISNTHPEIKDFSHNAMMNIYGTSDKDEARKIAIDSWLDSLDIEHREMFWSLVKYYQRLNDEGMSIAIDRVDELGQIPKYQRKR